MSAPRELARPGRVNQIQARPMERRLYVDAVEETPESGRTPDTRDLAVCHSAQERAIEVIEPDALSQSPRPLNGFIPSPSQRPSCQRPGAASATRGRRAS